MNEIKVQEFFKTEYPNFAVYNLYRMVASYVDGLKPSQRKIIHTMMKKNITTPKKVSQLAAEVSSETQYLHGEVNLQGVIVNMAQDFTGTNNMNLLHPESSFGNRCFPQAAAARYIFTHKSEHFNSVFNPEDNDLLVQQEFEGDRIEPKYFVPTLPLILINGSEGIGSGWSQKILPRNPKEIIKSIQKYIKTGKVQTERIKPWFKDFNGTINHVEDNSWEICGVLKEVNMTTYKILELPIGITLDKFTANLIKLEDNNTITSFTDFSDPGENKFEFEIKVKRQFTTKHSIEQAMRKFYLIKRVTENFTSMDENNEVVEFTNELQILSRYNDLRISYYEHRKAKNIQQINSLIAKLTNKAEFINDIIKNKLKIKNMTKQEIIDYLINKNCSKIDNSYNYLINMPIYSLTVDEYEKLKKEVEIKTAELKAITKIESPNMWLNDLKEIKK